MFHTAISEIVQSMCILLTITACMFCMGAMYLNRLKGFDGFVLFCAGAAEEVIRLDFTILVAAKLLNRYWMNYSSRVTSILFLTITILALILCFHRIRVHSDYIIAAHQVFCRLEEYVLEHRSEIDREKYQRMVKNLEKDQVFDVHHKYRQFFIDQSIDFAEQMGLKERG